MLLQCRMRLQYPMLAVLQSCTTSQNVALFDPFWLPSWFNGLILNMYFVRWQKIPFDMRHRWTLQLTESSWPNSVRVSRLSFRCILIGWPVYMVDHAVMCCIYRTVALNLPTYLLIISYVIYELVCGPLDRQCLMCRSDRGHGNDPLMFPSAWKWKGSSVKMTAGA